MQRSYNNRNELITIAVEDNTENTLFLTEI